MVAAWAGYFSKGIVTVREPVRGERKERAKETPPDSGKGTRFKMKIKKKML